MIRVRGETEWKMSLEDVERITTLEKNGIGEKVSKRIRISGLKVGSIIEIETEIKLVKNLYGREGVPFIFSANSGFLENLN